MSEKAEKPNLWLGGKGLGSEEGENIRKHPNFEALNSGKLRRPGTPAKLLPRAFSETAAAAVSRPLPSTVRREPRRPAARLRGRASSRVGGQRAELGRAGGLPGP